jgi:ketosteroid isomerase-like protein
MSEENVEIVRRAYEAFNRGDLDGMVADFAPEFEYVASGAVPGTRGVHPGTEGFRQYTEGFWGEFDDAQIEVHELTEARDQVLASVTFRGRGKQSGVEASWDIWQLWTLRDGKNVRGEGFPSRDEALKAAGLSE